MLEKSDKRENILESDQGNYIFKIGTSDLLQYFYFQRYFFNFEGTFGYLRGYKTF